MNCPFCNTIFYKTEKHNDFFKCKNEKCYNSPYVEFHYNEISFWISNVIINNRIFHIKSLSFYKLEKFNATILEEHGNYSKINKFCNLPKSTKELDDLGQMLYNLSIYA